MGVDPEEQVEILQARIHQRLAELRAIGQGVRVGAGGYESLDPDDGLDALEAESREIDLTDGIDLTDERLAGAGWDDEDDLADDSTDDPEDDWGDDRGDVLDAGGELPAEGFRRRQQTHRADSGSAGEEDPGPRLLEDRLDRSRPSLQDATDAVIDATRELINYERRLPMLLDAEPRRLSLMIVRWSGVLTAAVAASLLVAGLAGWLPRWWVLPALICGGAAFLLLRLPVHPPGDRHETLRPGSVVVAFGALLTALCAAAGMPTTVLLLGIVSIGAGTWHVQQTPLRIAALPRRFRESWR